MNEPKIIVQTTVALPADKVWEFYTNPQHIMKWNFASEDWKCSAASNDLTVGGRHFVRMEAKDGSFGFDFEAIFDDISIGNYYKYTMSDGRRLTANFSFVDGHTSVKLSFDPDEQYSADMQRKGWQAILDNFKKYVESQ